jgi:hypothetical protein
MPYGTTIAATGGSADAVVVSHTHTATTSLTDATISGSFPNASQSPLNYSGPFSQGSGFTSNGASVSGNFVTDFNSTHNHTATTTNTSTGVSGTNANLPPYLGINFIIKA